MIRIIVNSMLACIPSGITMICLIMLEADLVVTGFIPGIIFMGTFLHLEDNSY